MSDAPRAPLEAIEAVRRVLADERPEIQAWRLSQPEALHRRSERLAAEVWCLSHDHVHGALPCTQCLYDVRQALRHEERARAIEREFYETEDG